MKKLFSLLLLTATITTAVCAQNSPRLVIHNTTANVVYVQIYVSPPVVPGTTTCTVGYVSQIIAINPGPEHGYFPGDLPGVPPPPTGMMNVFLAARVLAGPTPCPNPVLDVSSYTCMGFPATITYSAKTPSCTTYGNITATWSFVPGMSNFLTFQ
jgi:hypothetical protein